MNLKLKLRVHLMNQWLEKLNSLIFTIDSTLSQSIYVLFHAVEADLKWREKMTFDLTISPKRTWIYYGSTAHSSVTNTHTCIWCLDTPTVR